MSVHVETCRQCSVFIRLQEAIRVCSRLEQREKRQIFSFATSRVRGEISNMSAYTKGAAVAFSISLLALKGFCIPAPRGPHLQTLCLMGVFSTATHN